MNTYAAYYDNKIRKDSSSGGVISLLSSYVFAHKGVVYGVTMSDDYAFAEFRRVENEEELRVLRGSKYLQAKVGDTFKSVKQDLELGVEVLFTGTACQVNGLRSFLQKGYSNLICVDVICHGVPTKKYWQKFIDGKNVKSVNFRCKDIGWENYGMKLNDAYIPNTENKYMKLYLQNACIRPSCYECVNKTDKKSDLTLGDFWGINDVAPEMNDKKGTSLVICRTEKGQQIFDEIKMHLIIKEVSYEDGVRNNPMEYKSTVKPEKRAEFFKDMEQMSFDELCYKYIPKVSLGEKLIRKSKSVVKKLIGKT